MSGTDKLHVYTGPGGDVMTVLTERGKTHGDFVQQALTSQLVKNIFRGQTNWERLSWCQQDALDMIAVKLSRILTGDPNVKDHWTDIAGYATLVAQQLKDPT